VAVRMRFREGIRFASSRSTGAGWHPVAPGRASCVRLGRRGPGGSGLACATCSCHISCRVRERFETKIRCKMAPPPAFYWESSSAQLDLCMAVVFYRFMEEVIMANQHVSSKKQWDNDRPAPKAAYHLLHLAFPQAGNGGIYVPRNVAGTDIPSGHAEGRALDLKLRTQAPAEKILGDAIFGLIIDSANIWGIDHVIWNRQIWSREHPHIRPFTGAYMKHGQPVRDRKGNLAMKDPHDKHLHIEWTRSGSQYIRLMSIERKLGQLKSDAEDLGVYSDSGGTL
jgi:hypothetical protein